MSNILTRCGSVADNCGWQTKDGRGHFYRNPSMPRSKSWEAFIDKRCLGDFPSRRAAVAAFVAATKESP